jgi:3-oxoacid CoA-transferase subunit A
MIDKLREDVYEVAALIPDGAVVGIGGFGNAGVPAMLCDALSDLGRTGLHIVANNAGIDPTGIGRLADEGRIRKFTGSFPVNDTLTGDIMSGKVELELVPQGTLAERLRAAGAGIPAFYTATSAGTPLATGEYPVRWDESGRPAEFPAAKETRDFSDVPTVLEHALYVDFALVHAHRADRLGNLVFRRTSRNFNPLVAMAAALTIAEAEQIAEVGALDPDQIHLPGIFVDHVVKEGR